MPQYIEEKEVDYLGYDMETLLSLVSHFCTWPIITNAKRMVTKAALIAPWRDSPNQHLSAYAQNLTRQQNNTKMYNVKITDDDKVMQLIACIYEANIPKELVMDK